MMLCSPMKRGPHKEVPYSLLLFSRAHADAATFCNNAGRSMSPMWSVIAAEIFLGTLFYAAEQPTTQEASLPSNQPDALKPSEEDGLASAAQARISVATALGVAAANAKLLADQEEREIEHLVASVIDNQVDLVVVNVVRKVIPAFLLIYNNLMGYVVSFLAD
jgi:hypothetical protein